MLMTSAGFGAALLTCAAVGLHLLADLRSTPTGFRWPEAGRSGTVPDAHDEHSSGIIPTA
jgi:hypothetical protein